MQNFFKNFKQIIAFLAVLSILVFCKSGKGCERWILPLFTYVSGQECSMANLVSNRVQDMLPLYTYGREPVLLVKPKEEQEQEEAVREWMAEENEAISASGAGEEEARITEALTLEELLLYENEKKTAFVPAAAKSMEYDWETMKDYESLLSTFYSIDSQALAGSDLFNLESLQGYDLKVKKTDAAPQILIYHTHSTEGFADSVPGERAQTIVGVGENLAQILKEEYGYGVLHHTEEYDTVRDHAYAKSLPAIEQLLEENPSIQVVIDLHRDSGNPNRNMVVDLNGKPTARFMFFNGISRSRQTGDIAYLYNPNLAENLAFSFQMQVAADEYYPGLTRKIYIKQYRYNMHLKGKTLLVELGDNNNTLEEAMNACYPLAHLLDLVLSGNAQ